MRILLLLTLLSSPGAASAELLPTETWEFLDNGKIRIGVNRSAGATIGWFSESGRDHNVLNRYDYGRYLQQSWYGEKDGSDWNGKPWRWNPVQAGNWTGTPAKARDLTVSENRITASTIPRHWASGEELAEVLFTEEILLKDEVAVVNFGVKYAGKASHPIHDQELPAVFLNAAYSKLHFFGPDDKEPRVITPAWPNERHTIVQPWVAYLDETGRGIGVLVPGVDTITCYRFPGDPNNRDKAACSYVAPIKRLAVTPGFEFRYTVYLTLGTLPQIRHRFHEIQKEREKE